MKASKPQNVTVDTVKSNTSIWHGLDSTILVVGFIIVTLAAGYEFGTGDYGWGVAFSFLVFVSGVIMVEFLQEGKK